jgi:hypothetical protein
VNSRLFRFLLAQLHLGSLIGKRSPKAIKIALQRLASGSEAYNDAYKEAMEILKSLQSRSCRGSPALRDP